MKELNKIPKTNISISVVLLIAGVIVFLWMCSPWIALKFFGTSYSQEAANFATTFSIIESLFSGLAFAGIIITIFLQQQELTETRLELSRSADAQEDSKELMSLTAQLNALNSRMQFCEIMSRVHINNPPVKQNYIVMMTNTNRRIEEVLQKLSGIENSQSNTKSHTKPDKID